MPLGIIERRGYVHFQLIQLVKTVLYITFLLKQQNGGQERGKQRVSGHMFICIFSCFAVLNGILEEYLRVITNISVFITTIVFIRNQNNFSRPLCGYQKPENALINSYSSLKTACLGDGVTTRY